MTSLKQETPAPTRKLQSLVYSFLQIQLSPQSKHHKLLFYFSFKIPNTKWRLTTKYYSNRWIWWISRLTKKHQSDQKGNIKTLLRNVPGLFDDVNKIVFKLIWIRVFLHGCVGDISWLSKMTYHDYVLFDLIFAGDPINLTLYLGVK